MKPQILLVEDSLPLARLICLTLKRLDVEVHHAKNGHEALVSLNENKPDLVFLDLRLPGISGWDVMAHGRQLYPDLQVIVLSAQNATHQHPEMENLYRYVVKPVLPTQIIYLVEEALGGRV